MRRNAYVPVSPSMLKVSVTPSVLTTSLSLLVSAPTEPEHHERIRPQRGLTLQGQDPQLDVWQLRHLCEMAQLLEHHFPAADLPQQYCLVDHRGQFKWRVTCGQYLLANHPGRYPPLEYSGGLENDLLVCGVDRAGVCLGLQQPGTAATCQASSDAASASSPMSSRYSGYSASAYSYHQARSLASAARSSSWVRRGSMTP